MFLFEKNLKGACCNRFYDLGENMTPFHAMAELKANSAGKNLNETNINTKVVLPNCQIDLPLNSSFLYESKPPSFRRRHQF